MKRIDEYSSVIPTDLVTKYDKAVKITKEKIAKENWRVTGEFYELTLDSFRDSSRTSRKKLRNRINRVLYKPTLRNINTLTHAKVKISEKEEEIQRKRKEWKKAQAIAERLLIEYKEEKGDFYKERIKNKETLDVEVQVA